MKCPLQSHFAPPAHGRDAWWRPAAHAIIVVSVAIGLWYTAILAFDPAALQDGVPAAGVVPNPGA